MPTKLHQDLCPQLAWAIEHDYCDLNLLAPHEIYLRAPKQPKEKKPPLLKIAHCPFCGLALSLEDHTNPVMP